MSNTTTRRPATEADLIVGAVVYKGNGKVAYRVYVTAEAGQRFAHMQYRTVGLVKTTTKTEPARWGAFGAAELTVEVTEVEAPAVKAQPVAVTVVPAVILTGKTVEGVEHVMEACGRCGGSGKYSFNLIDGDRCYGCEGRKGFWVTKADSDRRATNRAKDKVRRAAKAARLAAEREALVPLMVGEFVALNYDLRPLADRDDAVVTANGFLSSLRGQLLANGSLSQAQVDAARRVLPQEIAKAAQKAAERPQGVEQVQVAPEGRMTLTGRISGQYTAVVGPSWARKHVAKMWIDDDRGFTVSVSVPADLLDIDDNEGLTNRRVTLTATLERNASNPLKAWGTRPVKATFVTA